MSPWLCTAALLWLLASAAARAQDAGFGEYQVKAAFLYRFCLYVDWPPQAFTDTASPLVFGVAGPEQLVQQVQAVMRGHSVNGRPLEVRRIDDDPPLDGVQVLFIAGSEQERLPQLLQHARGLPLLVVTESPEALAGGSVINFALQDKRVRFDVSLDATARQGLRLSAQLLKVARRVLGEVRS